MSEPATGVQLEQQARRGTSTWAIARRRLLRDPGSVLALLVIATSVPLYRAVRQEFVPSDVDEAEFSINVDAPEGTTPSPRLPSSSTTSASTVGFPRLS